MRAIITAIFLIVCHSVMGASLAYEIYDFTQNDEGVLIAEGVKNYDISDLDVRERTTKEGEVWWKKTLWLNSEYGVSASLYRESKIRGFGLTGEISKEECDRAFSWEWFDIPFGPNIILKRESIKFEKLQETGEIEVRFVEIDGKQEIAEITFLTDISLRINTSQEIGIVSKRINIKKGSQLIYVP